MISVYTSSAFAASTWIRTALLSLATITAEAWDCLHQLRLTGILLQFLVALFQLIYLDTLVLNLLSLTIVSLHHAFEHFAALIQLLGQNRLSLSHLSTLPFAA